MPFSQSQRVLILETYIKTKSYEQVQTIFKEENPGVNPPNKSAISRLYAKFKSTGSVANQPHNRRRTVLTEEKVKEVSTLLQTTPNEPIDRVRQEAGLSYGSMQRAVKMLKIKKPIQARKKDTSNSSKQSPRRTQNSPKATPMQRPNSRKMRKLQFNSCNQ